MEINLEIDPKDAPVIEMNVLRSARKEEYTQINFYRERGMEQDATIVMARLHVSSACSPACLLRDKLLLYGL